LSGIGKGGSDDDDVSLAYFFYINNIIRIVLRHESINLYKCDYIFGWEDYTLMRSFSCRSE
jgi:hypothetical protein